MPRMNRSYSTRNLALKLPALAAAILSCGCLPAIAKGFQLEDDTAVVVRPKTDIKDVEATLMESADDAFKPQLGKPRTVKFQIGTKISTRHGAFTNIRIYLPVPTQWLEQEVSVTEESLYDQARPIKYRTLDAGVRQMLIVIPKVPKNTKADVLITYKVTIYPIGLPKVTEGLRVPKKKDRAIRMSLGSSPGLDPKNTSLKRIVKDLFPPATPPWEKAELIFGWIRDNIPEVAGPLQTTKQVMKSKKGNNEDRVALFVAMMRAARIPCRMVVTSSSANAEFCLEAPEGKQFWYPCSLRGIGEFGFLSRASVVFQKGDNLRMKEIKKRKRVIPEHVVGQGHVKPSVQIIRKIVQ